MTKKKSRRERFEEVAARRVQKVIESMDSLIKCSNRSNYEYHADDIEKMTKTLRDKLKVLETTFQNNLQHKKDTFKF